MIKYIIESHGCPPLFDAHHLTFKLWLSIGSPGFVSGPSSRFLFTAHYAVREAAYIPSYELLFRTDDLRSQHSPDRCLCWASAVRDLGT